MMPRFQQKLKDEALYTVSMDGSSGNSLYQPCFIKAPAAFKNAGRQA
jgi:hypothetical protein